MFQNQEFLSWTIIGPYGRINVSGSSDSPKNPVKGPVQGAKIPCQGHFYVQDSTIFRQNQEGGDDHGRAQEEQKGKI